MAYQAYLGITVTLTTADTNYNLLTLLQAVDPTCPPTARELIVQSSRANAGGSYINVGDGSMGASRCGYELAVRESRTYRSNKQDVFLGAMYVRPSANGLVLNVEVMGA